LGIPKFKDRLHDSDHAPLGWFVIFDLGLPVFNLPTKCEVSITVDYKDMKGSRKCRKWVF